jgi:hypothetical protein
LLGSKVFARVGRSVLSSAGETIELTFGRTGGAALTVVRPVKKLTQNVATVEVCTFIRVSCDRVANRLKQAEGDCSAMHFYGGWEGTPHHIPLILVRQESFLSFLILFLNA